MTFILAMVGSKRLQRNAHVLCLLNKCKPAGQRAIVQNSPPDVIDCLCEICLNVLKGNVPLTSKQKAKLSSYKASLRALVKKSTPTKRRRKILQKGGFLGALLGPLLKTIIGPLLSS